MQDLLTYEDFEPLVGRTIKVQIADSKTELEVAEAQLLKSSSPRKSTPFRVVLRSRNDWRASQGIFRIEHPTHGSVELFAVPIGPDGVGLCYEIVFN